jgi:S-adenosylmethionine hydrolase
MSPSAAPAGAPVVLLTDFGTRDWYVAAMKGVILARAPRAVLVDLTHEIPPQDVVAAAFTLAASTPWFPRGSVFVAVVDPGVGSRRALLAAKADGRYVLAPDNGLLSLVLAQATRATVVRISNRRYWLPAVSRTFQGRDILAPVAAFLAGGGSMARLGPKATGVQTLPLPVVHRRGTQQVGRVVHVDRFGALITNLRGGPGRPGWDVRYRGRRVPVVSTYSEGKPGQLIAVVGSLGLLELAVRNASAARLVGGRRGDVVHLERAPADRLRR